MKPSEIMNIMEDIEYGFKDENGNNIIDTDPKKWNDEFYKFYYLQTPEELKTTKCGVCWDQVELERMLFLENNINFKTYFIFIDEKNILPSHTFLVFKDNNKYYWFEHSWGKYKGIHEYKDEKELLVDVKEKFIKDEELSQKGDFYMYEYQKPIKHIKCDDFYKYIETQKKVEL